MGIVELKLNNILECYMRKEFDSEKGDIILRRNNPIGKFIAAHTRWSKIKPKEKIESVKLSIPDSPYFEQEYYYGYVTSQDERNIRDYIQAKFDLTVEMFFIKGYWLKFHQKDIIESLIEHFNLKNTSATYEMFKKRDFRKRMSVKKIISEIILNS